CLHPDLHSFPTRRSSDLNRRTGNINSGTERYGRQVDVKRRVIYALHTQTVYAMKGGRELAQESVLRAAETLFHPLRYKIVEALRSEEHTSELQSRSDLVC